MGEFSARLRLEIRKTLRAAAIAPALTAVLGSLLVSAAVFLFSLAGIGLDLLFHIQPARDIGLLIEAILLTPAYFLMFALGFSLALGYLIAPFFWIVCAVLRARGQHISPSRYMVIGMLMVPVVGLMLAAVLARPGLVIIGPFVGVLGAVYGCLAGYVFARLLGECEREI